jgi:hypothetical protein
VVGRLPEEERLILKEERVFELVFQIVAWKVFMNDN